MVGSLGDKRYQPLDEGSVLQGIASKFIRCKVALRTLGVPAEATLWRIKRQARWRDGEGALGLRALS
jgi:hypothetical protein